MFRTQTLSFFCFVLPHQPSLSNFTVQNLYTLLFLVPKATRLFIQIFQTQRFIIVFHPCFVAIITFLMNLFTVESFKKIFSKKSSLSFFVLSKKHFLTTPIHFTVSKTVPLSFLDSSIKIFFSKRILLICFRNNFSAPFKFIIQKFQEKTSLCNSFHSISPSSLAF